MSSNYDLTSEKIAALAKEWAFIPDDVWPTVKRWSVNATADFVCTQGGYFLLAKRAETPWQGQWFVPGGRILPGETSEKACRRAVKRELGFEPAEVKYVGEQPVYNPNSPEGVDWFSLWHLYEVPVGPDVKFRPNRENLELQWFNEIDYRWPWPVQRALSTMGWRVSDFQFDF